MVVEDTFKEWFLVALGNSEERKTMEQPVE